MGLQEKWGPGAEKVLQKGDPCTEARSLIGGKGKGKAEGTA